MDGEGPGRTRSGRRGLGIGLSLLLVAALSAPLGWWVTDRLESDNDFCNACHLQSGQPLHRAVRADFDARPAPSLGAAHGAAPVDERAFRCIDCHGGTGAWGRLRVKLLAAKDTFWYLSGHFDEPDGMRWPLWDEDCRKCHTGYRDDPSPKWQDPRFHELAVHNVELGVDCVSCHRVHDAGGPAAAHFVIPEVARAQCALCHPEFEVGVAVSDTAFRHPNVIEEGIR